MRVVGIADKHGRNYPLWQLRSECQSARAWPPCTCGFFLFIVKEIRSMIWSNWQGAIWRGAMVVLLFWSGLAWTQTPSSGPRIEAMDKFMVVTEADGKKTRCRVMETW